MDTLVSAWKHAGDLRDPSALRTWLLRIATRHALSRRRRRSYHSAGSFQVEGRSAEQPALDRLVLGEALAELPAKMRAAVVLHHYAGLTVPEISAVLGKSPNTVKSQLREGVARLRVALDAPQAQPERPAHDV